MPYDSVKDQIEAYVEAETEFETARKEYDAFEGNEIQLYQR